MARQKPRDVTDAELAVLRSLWEEGESTIRAIADRLYPGGETSHYATVQKLLERLEAKGFVKRRRAAVPHVFAATADRQAVIGRELQAMADKLCGGSLTPILSHLVESAPLGSAERDRLREWLADLSASVRPKAAKRASATASRSRKPEDRS